MSAAASPPAETADGSRRLLRRDRVTVAVLVITTVALALRFVDLGLRVAHWQEARLGWWLLESSRTGAPAAVGGPLVRLVGGVAVDTLGPTDLAIRVPVALVGGLSPLAALGFRRRLGDGEVIAAAGLLAAAPALVYYTRFASGDALAAVLALATVAAVVALRDAHRPELAVAAVVLGVLTVAAAPAAALGHLLALLGAWGIVLLLHAPPVDAPDADAAGTPLPRAIPDSLRATWQRAAPIAVGVGLVLSVVLLDPSVPSHLLAAPAEPLGLVYVVVGPLATIAAHLGLVARQLLEPPGLVESGVDLGRTLGRAAPAVTGLAVVGALSERWAARPIRPIVAIGVAWAVLGAALQLVVTGAGYPWVGIHVLVALGLPAAVGAIATWRWTRDAIAAGDPLTGAAGALAIVVAAAVLVAGLVAGVYIAPTAAVTAPVQYGQPSQDLRPAVDVLAERAVGVGPDLVLYGAHFVDGEVIGRAPACARWYNALPLPWYAAASRATTECATNATELRELLAASPAVIVGRAGPMTAVATPQGYRRVPTRFRAWNANVTVLVREEPATASVSELAAAGNP